MKQWELRGVTMDAPGAERIRESPLPVLTLDAIREREEPLRAVIEQLPALIWTTDRELRFTSSLGEGFFALGLAPNQVIGLHLSELFEGAHRLDACIGAHLRALGGGTSSFTLRWAGRTFRANVHPFQDGHGRVIGAVGVALDTRAQIEAGYEPAARRA
jgi:PAS domain S-box-containing protein